MAMGEDKRENGEKREKRQKREEIGPSQVIIMVTFFVFRFLMV